MILPLASIPQKLKSRPTLSCYLSAAIISFLTMASNKCQRSKVSIALSSYICDKNRDAVREILEFQATGQLHDDATIDAELALSNVMHTAVSCGYISDVQLLLDAGLSPTEPSPFAPYYHPPLLTAAEYGQRDIARLLWDIVGPENRFHPHQPRQSCLEVAAVNGHTVLVTNFLDMWDSWTPDEMRDALFGAASTWQTDVIDLLLTRTIYPANAIQDALAGCIRSSRNTPEDITRQHATVSRLVDAGGNPDGAALGSRTPMLLFATAKRCRGVLKALLEKGADPNAQDPQDGSSALHIAAVGGLIPTLGTAEILLQHGASPDLPNCEGETPIHIVASMGNLDQLKLFLEHCPDADAALRQRNVHGESILHYAAVGKNLEIVEFLIGCGHDINAASDNGWTPLVCALMPTGERQVSTAIRIAKFLLRHGASANVVTAENWTPMHSIASWPPASYPDGWPGDDSGMAPMVSELISRGTDLDVCAPVLLARDLTYYAVIGQWGIRMKRLAENEAKREKEMVRDEDTAPHMWAFRMRRENVFQTILDHWTSQSQP